jgi:hypothetical protein
MAGIQAQFPFSGSATNTHTFPSMMSGIWVTNDGGSDITLTVNGNIFTIKPLETFDEFLAPFNTITITNASASAYRGYVRG